MVRASSAHATRPAGSLSKAGDGQDDDRGHNRLVLARVSDWSSDRESSVAEMKDEIDIAIQKCLEDQTSLNKLHITKISKGQYLLQNKEYTMRLL